MCNEKGIKHNVSQSVTYLLDKINDVASPTKHAIHNNDYIMPLRKCVMKLIELNIERGHSSHENNNIIATELVAAGYKNRDIYFIFSSIYDEPGGDWGWYTDNPNKAGRQIDLIRSKALNRYSKDKLIQLNICTDKCGCV